MPGLAEAPYWLVSQAAIAATPLLPKLKSVMLSSLVVPLFEHALLPSWFRLAYLHSKSSDWKIQREPWKFQGENANKTEPGFKSIAHNPSSLLTPLNVGMPATCGLARRILARPLHLSVNISRQGTIAFSNAGLSGRRARVSQIKAMRLHICARLYITPSHAQHCTRALCGQTTSLICSLCGMCISFSPA